MKSVADEQSQTITRTLRILGTPQYMSPERLRDPADVDRYNAIARRIMAEHDIAIDDLFAVVAARQAEFLPKVDVHLPAEGSKALGLAVADAVRAALRED